MELDLDTTLPGISPEGYEGLYESEANKVAPFPTPELQQKFINYVNILRALYENAMVQSQRLSDKTQANTIQLKREVRSNSKTSSALQEKVAKAAMWSGIFAFSFMVCQFAFQNQENRNMVKWMGENLPQAMSNMYSNFRMAERTLSDALLAMHQTELQAVAQKNQENMVQPSIQQLGDLAASLNQKGASPT